MRRFSFLLGTGILGTLLVAGFLLRFVFPTFLPRLDGSKAPRPIALHEGRPQAFNVGEKFPDLHLKTVDGESFRPLAHPYKVLVINFFNTW